jgi:glycerol-3-phosphate acyltransferase PlsY
MGDEKSEEWACGPTATRRWGNCRGNRVQVRAMTRAHWMMIAMIPAAYVVGAIPFGLMVGRAKGIDPRKAGSGNIGATNLGRLLGVKFFAIVFVLDLIKGLLPMLAGAWWVRGHFARPDAGVYVLWLMLGFAAILGHMFSLFIGFKGGKGVATSCGVVLGLFPYYTWAGLIVLGVWVVLFLATRYVSVASMVAAGLFPVAYAGLALANGWPMAREQLPLLVFAVMVAGMIVYKHRGNLARLRAGTKHRFVRKGA